MKSLNLINGQHLEFGNADQIKSLMAAQEWHQLFPISDRQPNVLMDCIVCAGHIQAKKHWTGYTYEIITPAIHSCSRCGTRVMFILRDPEGEYRYESAPSVFYKFLGKNEIPDLLEFVHPDDPKKYYHNLPKSGENGAFSRQNTLGL